RFRISPPLVYPEVCAPRAASPPADASRGAGPRESTSRQLPAPGREGNDRTVQCGRRDRHESLPTAAHAFPPSTAGKPSRRGRILCCCPCIPAAEILAAFRRGGGPICQQKGRPHCHYTP